MQGLKEKSSTSVMDRTFDVQCTVTHYIDSATLSSRLLASILLKNLNSAAVKLYYMETGNLNPHIRCRHPDFNSMINGFWYARAMHGWLQSS
jgi:hypothetical protein